MVSQTRTQICFKVPRSLKRALQRIAESRGLTLSQIFQSFAIQLVLNEDPRILKEKDVQEWLDEVLLDEEDSVHLPND